MVRRFTIFYFHTRKLRNRSRSSGRYRPIGYPCRSRCVLSGKHGVRLRRGSGSGRTTEVLLCFGALSARVTRESLAREEAAPPATARLAPSVANDAAAPETEARPPRQAAADARTPRGGVHCVAAIAGETQERVEAVTAIAPGCARESGRHVDS